MRGTRFLAALLVLSACARKPVPPQGPRLEDDALLQAVRARPVADVLQGRFSIKMRSPKLGIVAPRLAGALVVERPDRAWIAVYDPVGSPVVQLASDGSRVIFLNGRDRIAVVEEGVADMLAEASGGQFRMADIVDVLLGLVPVDRLEAVGREASAEPDGPVRYDFRGPADTKVVTWLDAVGGTPQRVEVWSTGDAPTIVATYPPFAAQEDGALMPAGLLVEVPSVELSLDLAFKSWKVLDTSPDVFAPPVPEGFTSMDFAAYGERERQRRKMDGAASPDAPPSGKPPRDGASP